MQKLIKFTFALFLISLLIPVSTNAAQVDYFLKIEGVEGESQDREHEGWSDITSLSWGVQIPSDRASGLATGKRQHRPFSVVKEIDKATPKLMEYCANGVVSDKIEIQAVRLDPKTNEPLPYFTIILREARITSYNFSSVNNLDDNNLQTETFTINYKSIEYRYEPFGTTFKDDWR